MGVLRFICSHCGTFARSTFDGDDILDSGTTLTCHECGKDTVVDLDKPEVRAERYRRAGLL